MKKILLIAALAAGVATASAQDALRATGIGSNWSIGLDGGVTTPLKKHPFFGDMRGTVGAHIAKQLTPTFGLGVEGQFGVNTSSWSGHKSATAFDNLYLGAYGTVNLFNLFSGYVPAQRVFDIDAVAGAGWGRDIYNLGSGQYHNYFATKAGLNFNFHPSEKVTISLKPYVAWDMSDADVRFSSAAYNANKATFNFLAGVTYNFGPGFEAVREYNQAEVDALNAQVNALRADVAAAALAAEASQAQAAALAIQLDSCLNQAPKVIKEETNTLSSVRYVFFRIGSSTITADQQPNVEMIAAYLKNHPDSKVVIKGYASKDGNEEFNIKLAAARAESVRTSLIKKYGIKASRIQAEGEGIGNMFTEESWNRVSICTIED
ncbi:MAG: OmpA family protein [Paramuribaculum sp.]|nr:OmpA family protein [Paramuribaculum sp.]